MFVGLLEVSGSLIMRMIFIRCKNYTLVKKKNFQTGIFIKFKRIDKFL